MTIPRTWTKGVYSMPLSAAGTPMLSSADSAQLDANVQRAVDKTYSANQTIFGELQVDPGGVVSLDSSTSSFLLTGSAVAETSAGGRILCNDDDFPEFNVARTFARFIPFQELQGGRTDDVVGGMPGLGDMLGSISPVGVKFGYGNVGGLVPSQGFATPLTRVHDGATLHRIGVYFSVSATRAQLPNTFPSLELLKIDPFLGTSTSLTGRVFFPTAPNIGAYQGINFLYANGTMPTPHSGALAEVIDISNYQYVLNVVDEDYGTEVNTVLGDVYMGIYLFYSSVSDMRFQ